MKSELSSQNQEILAILQSGNPLTVYEMHIMGINGATARIKELRDMGYNIVSNKRKHINKHGRVVTTVIYTLGA